MRHWQHGWPWHDETELVKTESAPSETQNENQKHDDTPVDLGINDFQRKTYGWCF